MTTQKPNQPNPASTPSKQKPAAKSPAPAQPAKGMPAKPAKKK